MSPNFSWRLVSFATLALLLLAPATTHAATTFTTLHTFGAYQDGANPAYNATLLTASDGNFYGTTLNGGTNAGGTVYQLTPAGVIKTLHSFTNIGTPLDGYAPYGKLLEGKDGYLYGTTYNGGANGGGTIYRLKKDGTAFGVVYEFTSAAYHPYSGLAQDSGSVLYGSAFSGTGSDGIIYKIKTDGTSFAIVHALLSNGSEGTSLYFSPVLNGTTLYGTAYGGGTNSRGTVYRVKTDGSGFTLLHSFTATATDGYNPVNVFIGKDGKIYGATYYGGKNGNGTLFSLATSGSGYTDFHDFTTATDGYYPQPAPVQDSDSQLYGVTLGGGTAGTAGAHGTIYKIKTDGTGLTILHSFLADGSEGANGAAQTGLAFGADSKLYGARTNGGGTRNIGFAYSVSTTGTGFKTVFDFSNGFVDGANPYYGSLILGAGNNYYGTTYHGGAAGGYGTVYKMAPGGTVTILHAFSDNEAAEDGANPYGGLLTGSGSTMLGTTFYGGSYGAGIAFSVDGSGNFATLADFGQAAGANLPSDLVRTSSGILYGTSYYGGRYNKGSVFRIGTDGFESVIYSFRNTTDGQYPNGKLLVGKDGSLYGTTYSGGSSGYGTLYQVTPAGAFKILHTFKSDGSEGSNPYSGLIQDSGGKLYGTTYQRGQFGYGTLYALGTDGSSYKTLHAFATATEGAYPYAGVLLASDGRLYGTTSQKGSINGGSNNGYGTVYRVNTSGSSFTVLHTFKNDGTEGGNPYSGLLEGPDGNVLGTTYNGGALPYPGTKVYGSAFKLSTLLPLVSLFTPTSGAVGTSVTLTGLNFTGASAVLFGGATTNAFTLVSDTKITVAVPSNAKTGPIVVTTSKGNGTSTATFTVK